MIYNNWALLMNNRCKLLIFLLIILGCARIISVHDEFIQTYDEPAHIACGMEWIDKGTYFYEPQHPPLTRIMAAVGPYLIGERSQGGGSIWEEGNLILYNNDYMKTLMAARLGNLLFFILACLGVAVLSWKIFDPLTAVAGVFIFSMMPSILGNSGVATTDMGPTAFYAPAIMLFAVWWREKNIRNSMLLGLLLAASVFSKFSTILYLVIGFGVVVPLLFLRGELYDESDSWGHFFKMTGLVVLVFLFAGWASYRFSINPLLTFPRDMHWIDLFSAKLGLSKETLIAMGSFPVPLSELFRGIAAVFKHNVEGHGTYLLGEVGLHGWWYYFPVVLGVKVPLGILAAFAAGGSLVFLDRKSWCSMRLLLILIPLGVLFSCMFISNMNAGIRHILPIFPFIAVVGGYGLVWFYRKASLYRVVGIGGAVSILAASVIAHPAYISSFNYIAREKPYEYLVKADLDWGQYVMDLSRVLEKRDIKNLSIIYVGTADLTKHPLPSFNDITEEIPQTVQGWVAINANPLFTKSQYFWLKKYKPVQIIRNSFFLYYFDSPVKTDS